MPISQSRMMTVLAGARKLIDAHQEMHETINADIIEDITYANSVIANTTDEQAKTATERLLARILAIQKMLSILHNPEFASHIAVIATEEFHFAKAARRNEKAAYYHQQARMRQGIQPRHKEAEPTKPAQVRDTSMPADYAVADVNNDPDFIAWQRKMHATWTVDAASATDNLASPDSVPSSIASAATLDSVASHTRKTDTDSVADATAPAPSVMRKLADGTLTSAPNASELNSSAPDTSADLF